jgi:hypothetical protein
MFELCNGVCDLKVSLKYISNKLNAHITLLQIITGHRVSPIP